MSIERPNQSPPAADGKLNPQPAEPAKSDATPRRDGRVILLVDYEYLLISSLRQLFEADGFTVLSERSLEGALRICQQYSGKIDALVVGVPGNPAVGFDLAVAVASKYPGISVVFTWDPPLAIEASDCATCKRAAQHFLPKPFVYSQLRRKILQLLSEPLQPTQDWLLHFYKKPEKTNPVTPEKPTNETETTRHLKVQLEVFVRGESLFVAGLRRDQEGGEQPCWIELHAEAGQTSRPLRWKDLESVLEPKLRFIVDSATDEPPMRRQLKKRSRKQS